jgi:hypothetical protein
MNKILFAIISIWGLGVYGNTITGVTTNIGTTFTVTEPNSQVTGALMAGMVITADFGATPESCTFTAAGTCSDVGGNFTISFPVAFSTDPDTSGFASLWTISNTTKTLGSLTSLNINGLAGNIGFDRCLTTGGFLDTDFGFTVCNGATALEGTPGSAFGWSAGNDCPTSPSACVPSGTAGITAAAVYFNALHVAADPSPGLLDAWGDLTLNFSGAAFAPADTFTFRADTDAITTQVSDTPEVGTLGLVGAMLLGIGALRFRPRVS